jgi:hypothetical protein
MSGFILEKRFFVSAAHFEPGPEVTAQWFLHGKISTLRLSHNGMFPFLVVSGFRIIIVLCVCTIGTDPWTRAAELIHWDSEADIAVYRLLPGVPDATNWCSLGQLAAGNLIEEGSRVFTVGYNGTSNAQEFVANAAAYISNLSPSKREALLSQTVHTVSSSSLECAFASPNLTSAGSRLRYGFCAQPAHGSCWYAHRPRNQASWNPLSYRLRVVWYEWMTSRRHLECTKRVYQIIYTPSFNP